MNMFVSDEKYLWNIWLKVTCENLSAVFFEVI